MPNKDYSLVPIYTFEVLKKYSDENHLLSTSDILEHINFDYNESFPDEKIITRAIKRLQAMQNNSEITIFTKPGRNGGIYIEYPHNISNNDLAMLIDLVKNNDFFENKDELIESLLNLGNAKINNIDTSHDDVHTRNQNYFYTLDAINKSISKKQTISFDYMKYNEKKELVLHKIHFVYPLKMINANNKLYLASIDLNSDGTLNTEKNGVMMLRVDHIADVKNINLKKTIDHETIEEYKKQISSSRIKQMRPYIFTDEPQKILFYTNKNTLDQVIDIWGNQLKIQKIGAERFLCEIKTSPTNFKIVAKQFIPYIEIFKPVKLKDAFVKELKSAIDSFK